jgi:hypothetical protein
MEQLAAGHEGFLADMAMQLGRRTVPNLSA